MAGDPVAHSLSPRMHMAAITALGLDALYLAARTTARAFPALVRSVLEQGGGLNVTMPFKADAAAAVTRASEAVRRSGACNTIWGDPDAPQGDNTDVEGVREVMRELADGRTGGRAVIQGTGGAARSVAVALADEWPGVDVAVLSRDAARAEAFVAWAREAGVPSSVCGAGDVGAELIVRAVPADFPQPGAAARGVRWALDLVYQPDETAFVHAMRHAGARAADGRGVLVAQGVAAFRRFFGVEPPAGVMRDAVEDALRL